MLGFMLLLGAGALDRRSMLSVPQVARIAILAGVLVLPNCMRVPAADELAQGPSIDEIVQRVKCDLYNAVEGPLNSASGFEWLHTWTVQASLNLIVNEQSQFTPGMVLTRPLTAVTIPQKVTNFSQSATLGLGGQANNTATRNETVTFTFAMEDLRQFGERKRHCNFPDGVDLRSELGVKEWFLASLEPVRSGQLRIGYHKAPRSGSGAAAATAKTAIQNLQGAMAQPTVRRAPPKPGETVNCDDPAQIPNRSSGPPGRGSVRRDEAIVACELGLFFKDPGAKGAIDLSSQLDGQTVRTIALIIKDIDRLIDDLSVDASEAATREALALKNVAINLSVFVDPPLDTISHQAQFIIVWNGNVSPSWTLVNFKGPSPASGALFSATRTMTHTLNIVAGPPSSEDSRGALLALQTGTSVGNALITNGIIPP